MPAEAPDSIQFELPLPDLCGLLTLQSTNVIFVTLRRHKFHSAWIRSDGSIGSTGSASSLFPWWGFTKTVLAISALRLVEEERIDLDVLRPNKPYAVRQLLQHRAGVPNYGSLTAYHEAVARNDVPWPRERLLEAVGSILGNK